MIDQHYSFDQSVSYSSMIWLLVAQLLVMLPFALQLPIWLIPILLLSTGWRMLVVRGKVTQPQGRIKLLAVMVGIMGLILSGLRPPDLNAMVAILLLGFAFKALEMVQRRDAIVVIFLGYLLTALQFLYSQAIFASLYGCLCLIILTAALISIQQQSEQAPASQQNAYRHVRLATLLLLQCLPLMVLLFLFAPRFPPIWVLPTMNAQYKTGIADQMAPGDIANLSKSDQLAFRVTFQDKRPNQNQLYWRGLTLNHFDGQKWTQFPQDYDFSGLKAVIQSSYNWLSAEVQLQGEPISYEAIYENSGQPWLFTLTTVAKTEGAIMRAADYRIMAKQIIDSPFLLRATSYPEAIRDSTLHPLVRQLALQLPPQGNTRSRDFAKQLRASVTDDLAYVHAVLKRFQRQDYYYTLRPPLLGDQDTIDRFLFDSMRGFCSHYAGSFVYLMRAVGIPARVVTGYQGGEWNADANYLTVRQYDAHAWTEVWLADKGWQRFDPTAMVAPSRIEQGLQAAVAYEGSFLEDSLFSAQKIPWLTGIRQSIDQAQYQWRRWVLGYDNRTQATFFQQLLGDITVLKLVLLLLLSLSLLALFWMVHLGLLKPRPQEALEHRLYRQFCQLLATKKGVTRQPQQTPQAFLQQATIQLPQFSTQLQAITQLYETLCYDPDAQQRSRQLQTLKHLVRRLQKALR